MAVGLQSRLNILQASPHDSRTLARSEVAHDPALGRWIPSRYTIRANSEDGRLILWNTFRGSMSVFRADQAEAVLALLGRQGITARKEGLVAYLVQRGYLLREGTNEYRQVQGAIHQQHYRTDRLEYILMASEDCNFRCKYCYEEFARGTMLPEVREAIKKHAAKAISRLQFLQVGWFGGEPLYGWEAVEDLAPYLQQLARDNDVGYFSHMTTNGYLLTPEIAGKLLAWDVRKYQITIDGMPEHHDCSRPTRDGRPTFATILENLRAMASRDDSFQVAIRVNFDRENGPHLSPFLELLERDFANDPRFGLLFRAVGRWGGGNDANLDVCGATEAAQLKDQLTAEAKRRGLQIGDIRGVNNLGSQVCYAARPYNYLIGATGKIMKCTISLDTQDNNVVGHLTPEGNMVLDRDKMALWTEPAFENDPKCQKCVVVPLCQGTHCPLIRIDEGVSPCCGTRSSGKRELQALLEEGARARRKVPVAAAPLPLQDDSLRSAQPPAG
jgi:uncharacterized protein